MLVWYDNRSIRTLHVRTCVLAILLRGALLSRSWWVANVPFLAFIHSHCACMCLELSVGSPNPAIHSASHVSLSPSVLFEPRRHHRLTTTTLWSAWHMAENTTESDRLPSSNFRPILEKQNPTKQATSPIVFYSFNAAASTNCALQWVRYCYFLSPPPYEKTGATVRACRLP